MPATPRSGMSLCALHNGGGVGIGKAINGGFGLVLDGSARVDDIIRSAMMLGRYGRRRQAELGAQRGHGMETAMDYNKTRRANDRPYNNTLHC